MAESDQTEIFEVTSNAEAKSTGIRAGAEKFYPHAVVEKAPAPSEVEDNPYALRTIEGALRRIANLEQQEQEGLVDSGKPKSKISIESGVFAVGPQTDVSSVYVISFKGKLAPNDIDHQSHRINFPDKVTIRKYKPGAKEGEEVVSIEGTPLSPDMLAATAGEPNTRYVDIATAVLQSRSGDTYLALSTGTDFDSRDVLEAIVKRGGRARVSEVMLERLQLDNKVTKEGYIVRDGVVTNEKFDPQDPHKYISGGTDTRAQQIELMTTALFAEASKR